MLAVAPFHDEPLERSMLDLASRRQRRAAKRWTIWLLLAECPRSPYLRGAGVWITPWYGVLWTFTCIPYLHGAGVWNGTMDAMP